MPRAFVSVYLYLPGHCCGSVCPYSACQGFSLVEWPHHPIANTYCIRGLTLISIKIMFSLASYWWTGTCNRHLFGPLFQVACFSCMWGGVSKLMLCWCTWIFLFHWCLSPTALFLQAFQLSVSAWFQMTSSNARELAELEVWWEEISPHSDQAAALFPVSPKEQTTARISVTKCDLNLLLCDLTKLLDSDFFVLLIFAEILFSLLGGKANVFFKGFCPSLMCEAFLEACSHLSKSGAPFDSNQEMPLFQLSKSFSWIIWSATHSHMPQETFSTS